MILKLNIHCENLFWPAGIFDANCETFPQVATKSDFCRRICADRFRRYWLAFYRNSAETNYRVPFSRDHSAASVSRHHNRLVALLRKFPARARLGPAQI